MHDTTGRYPRAFGVKPLSPALVSAGQESDTSSRGDFPFLCIHESARSSPNSSNMKHSTMPNRARGCPYGSHLAVYGVSQTAKDGLNGGRGLSRPTFCRSTTWIL